MQACYLLAEHSPRLWHYGGLPSPFYIVLCRRNYLETHGLKKVVNLTIARILGKPGMWAS